MAKEWTDDEVREEISAAVKIVQADKERAEYNRLHGLYGTKSDSEDNPDDKQDDDKVPPPKKEGSPQDKTNGRKRSIWWAATDDDES